MVDADKLNPRNKIFFEEYKKIVLKVEDIRFKISICTDNRQREKLIKYLLNNTKKLIGLEQQISRNWVYEVGPLGSHKHPKKEDIPFVGESDDFDTYGF